MKRIFTLLSLAIITVVNAQYDGFAYNTALNSNGWTTYSGAEGQLIPLTTPSDNGNSLAYSGIPTSKGNRIFLTPTNTEDVTKSFDEEATKSAYASFLIKVTDTSTAHPNTFAYAPTGYFFHFSPNTGTIGTTGLVGRLGIRQGSNSNKFNIALLNTTGGSASLTDLYGQTPIEYNINETYFVVVKYDMSGEKGKSSIWINSLSENNPTHESEFGSSTKLSVIKSVGFREAPNGGNIEIDEVRLGSTWDEVTKVTLSTDDIIDKNRNIISNNIIIDQFKVLSNQQTFMKIYSLNGQLVKSSKLAPQSNVNISNLSSGIYVIKITEGAKTYIQKVIKK